MDPRAASGIGTTHGNRDRHRGRAERLSQTTNETIEEVGQLIAQGFGRRIQGHLALQRDGKRRVASQRTTRTMYALPALYPAHERRVRTPLGRDRTRRYTHDLAVRNERANIDCRPAYRVS